jgi:integrase
MPLSDPACKTATCPAEKKRRRMTDSGGLYLEISPAGSKRWFWKYSFTSKEKRLALGSYPDVSLKTARLERDKARLTLQAGNDPAHLKQVGKLRNQQLAGVTFEAVAREFHKKKASGWAEHYGKWWLRRMETMAFPWIGKLPLDKIDAPALLTVLHRVEARGAHETAHTLCRGMGQVFMYGIQTGKCSTNPVSNLRGALQPINTKHVGAITEPVAAGELMREIYGFSGQPTTRIALALSAMVFQRPGNVRSMQWAHVDLAGATWTIPAAEMKRKKEDKANGAPHLVPLADQAVALFRELQPLTGHGRYVFPSLLTGERPMSENTLRAALRRLGYSNDEMTAHGFRAMARTLIAEQLHADPEIIETQLAHGKSGPLGAAYDRAKYLDKRRTMMQEWADYLDALRAGAKILPFKAA